MVKQRIKRNVCVAARIRRFRKSIYCEKYTQLSSQLSRFHFAFLMFVCLVHHSTLHCDLFYPLDVNECDENPSYCQYGGQCVNTPGSYRCLCQQGYEAGNGGTYCIGKGVCLTVCQ